MSRVRVVCLALSGLIFGLQFGGCPLTPPPTVPPADAPAANLTLGTFDTTLSPNDLNIFRVLGPGELALDVTITPVAESVLGIGFAEAPDGTTLFGSIGGSAVSDDGTIAATPVSSTFGSGVRLFGTTDETGFWRFSVEVDPTGATSAVQEEIGRLSFVGQLAVFFWNVSGQPSSGPLFDFIAGQVPSFERLTERVPAIIEITLSDPSNPGTGGGDTDITPAPTSIALEQIVRTGDDVPGQPGATFTYFGNPLIDDEERVAFFAGYTGGTGSNGLYVFEDGTLQRVFDNAPTTPVPGGVASDTFGGNDIGWDSGAPSLAWGPDGRLLFVAHINDSGLPNAVFRWRAVDGDLLDLVLPTSFQALFTNASDDFLPEFYFPGLSDTGIVHFTSRYSFFDNDGAFVFFDNGIFSTNGVRLQAIVDEQITPTTPVPGRPGGTFSSFELVAAHNTSGNILLQGGYQGGGGGTTGLYLWNGTTLSRVLDNGGSPLPGLTTGTTIGAAGQPFTSVAIGDRGEIAVNAPLTVAGATNPEVIYFDGTDWTRLAGANGRRAGFLMSGINRRGQVVFRAGGDPHLGDGGAPVRLSDTIPGRLITAGVTWPGFGAALNNQNRCVLRFERTSGGPGLLFWNGSTLLDVADLEIGQPEAWDTIFSADQPVLDDDLTRRSTVTDRPELDRPGRTGMLSDGDVLVFRIGSTGADATEDTGDDEQAIYIGRGQR